MLAVEADQGSGWICQIVVCGFDNNGAANVADLTDATGATIVTGASLQFLLLLEP